MCAFTAAEHDYHAYLVSSFEEPAYVVDFRQEIMVFDLHPELDGFKLLLPAASAGIFGLLLHLITVFAVVEQFGNGRLGRFTYKDQVQINFARTPDGFAGIYDALLLAIGSDEPYLSDTNLIIHLQFSRYGLHLQKIVRSLQGAACHSSTAGQLTATSVRLEVCAVRDIRHHAFRLQKA